MNAMKCVIATISLYQQKLTILVKLTKDWRSVNMAWRPFFDRYNSMNLHPMNDPEYVMESLYKQKK